MGLRPGEPRALARIESQLAESDPTLATMFAAFNVGHARSRRSRARHIAVIITLAACLAACITMAVLTA